MDQTFIQDQNQIREDYKDEDNYIKPQNPIRRIFCSKISKGLLFLTCFAIAVPTLVYYFVINRGFYEEYDLHTCAVDNNFKITCGEANATQTYCAKISCCFDNSTKTCYHYLPSKYYYRITDNSKEYEPKQEQTPYETVMLKNIMISISDINENRLKITLHTTESKVQTNTVSNKSYNAVLYDDPLAVEVYRNENEELLLTTAEGPLIASNGYWEWSFRLTNEHLFGFGETLLKVEENSTLTKVIYKNRLDHNTVPNFMAHQNGLFHGVVVRHIGPLEVTVLPSNLVILKTLVGSQMEIEMSLGPTPKDVVNDLVSVKSMVPPYWMLGTHICRGGNSLDLKSILDEYENFLNENTDLEYESDCIHENLIMIMYAGVDDTQKARLIAAIKNLIDSNKAFVLSLPPQILTDTNLYSEADNLGILYKDSQNSLYKGSYLGKEVVYPDYSHQSINKFIEVLFSEIKTYFEYNPQGLILTDNWPVDDSFNMVQTDDFPYLSENLIQGMSYTLPWNSKSAEISHIINHNQYGSTHLESIANNNISQNIFIMSAVYNSGMKTSSIVENVEISWTDFNNEIRRILYNSLFGNTLITVPVCGSTDAYDTATDESLCIRWYLMAATMPIFRISSDLPRRDPNSLNSGFAANAAKNAIIKRNMLLPYYNTVLNKNELLMRPMFYEFYKDIATFDLDGQYMLGNALLVSHPILPDKSQLRVYLPPSVGVWYELWGGIRYVTDAENNFVSLNIVETDWISFIAAGNILPLIQVDSSQNATILNLIVALNCNEVCNATGSLLVGANYLNFLATEKQITIDGLTDEIKFEMQCSTLQYLVEKISLYNTDVKIFTKNENLCDADQQIIIPFD